jgi:hypothetical protein
MRKGVIIIFSWLHIMDINIVTIAYLFFRLAPFIIVSYFSLSSLFNQDIKGLIYLAGLLIACTLTSIISILFPNTDAVNNPPNAMCGNFTIGGQTLTNLPLGISSLSYTFFYLLFVIVKNHLELSNLPTIIIFPILIAGDLAWNLSHSCFNIIQVFVSIIVGGSIGLLWGWAIDSINNPSLLYINTGGTQTVCNRPSKQLFKCTFPKTKDVSTTTSAFTTMKEAYSENLASNTGPSNPNNKYVVADPPQPVLITTLPTVVATKPPSVSTQALQMIQESNNISNKMMNNISSLVQ